MVHQGTLEVAKTDLQAAWAVLENLAVSLDQIGGKFATEQRPVNGAQCPRRVQEALASYFTPGLVKAINDARTRLGKYISDEEAEAIAEHICYWDVVAACKSPARHGDSA